MSVSSELAPRDGTAEEYYRDLWRRLGEGDRLPGWEVARWREIERLLTRIEPAASGEGVRWRVLDLGCGRGWITRLLAERLPTSDVSGIDPLESSVSAARELAADLRFRRGTAADLLAAGEAGSYDLVVSSEVIEHVPEREQPAFLATARELLRPGGFLLLTTPRGELWARWRRGRREMQPVEDWLSEAELEALARRAGLEPIQRSRVHVPTRPLTWQGWLDKWVLGRRFVRDLPLGPLRRRLRRAASLYQVVLLRVPGDGSQPGSPSAAAARGPVA